MLNAQHLHTFLPVAALAQPMRRSFSAANAQRKSLARLEADMLHTSIVSPRAAMIVLDHDPHDEHIMIQEAGATTLVPSSEPKTDVLPTSIVSPSTATILLMNTSSSRKEEPPPMPFAGWKMTTSPGVGGLCRFTSEKAPTP